MKIKFKILLLSVASLQVWAAPYVTVRKGDTTGPEPPFSNFWKYTLADDHVFSIY